MIHSGIALVGRYADVLPKLEKAAAFLRALDVDSLTPGRIEIDGKTMFASVNTYTTEDAAKRRFEAHDVYIDVQYVAKGREMIAVADRSGLTLDGAYDGEKDLAFYHNPATCSTLILEQGDFAVLFPDEAHKPGCAIDGTTSAVTKVVVKIAI